MELSQEGVDLIKQFEGCKLTAYKPVATEKYWTIGYGHYGADVKKGMVITQARAEELLRQDIRPIEKMLNKMCINFKQRQFDALCSWCYNLGNGRFISSTMCKKIQAGASDVDVTDQLVKWVNAGGKAMLGLKRRRVAEANMFLGETRYYLDKNNNIAR